MSPLCLAPWSFRVILASFRHELTLQTDREYPRQPTTGVKAEPATNEQLYVYEGSTITVKGEVVGKHAALVEEVTFKFFVDGEQSEEKTVSMTEGAKDKNTGNVTVNHTLKAPTVPDDKESSVLDYHVFYEVKNKDGTTTTQENLAVRKFQVLPRTAQLAVTHITGGAAIPNFQFKVFQAGKQVGGVQTTFAKDTKNAKNETVPAGTAEFNLDLKPGFRIVQESPFEIVEETVSTGRKRTAKGDIKFRAAFIAPKSLAIRQYVNEASRNQGQTGFGDEVVIEVGVEGDEDRKPKIGNEATEVHFRVTYGPGDGETQAKSARDDANHPTKAKKMSDSDTTATVEEKEANKKYEGKVKLPGGRGCFKVSLGKAGGDTCTVEIAGSDKFLTDEAVTPDQTMKFENWRRVYYEIVAPDFMCGSLLDPSSLDFGAESGRQLESLGRPLFIEFVHDKTHLFKPVEQAGHGTLLPRRFLGAEEGTGSFAYVLSGRNWRDLPSGQAWADKHPGKTLKIALCDRMLKWRKDTSDPQAGTQDFSGTLTEAKGKLNVQEKFSGFFLPFSGFDSGDGIGDIEWTADIAGSDDVGKFTPELNIEDHRHDGRIGNALVIEVDATDALPADPVQIIFKRPHYPGLKVKDASTAAALDEADDGKVTIKETVLNKELVLQFPTISESDEGESDDDPTSLTEDQQDQVRSFFESLFKDNKDALRATAQSNQFVIEVQGKSGADGRSRRIEEVMWAVQCAYTDTSSYASHNYVATDLGVAETALIKQFVDAALSDKSLLRDFDAKVNVRVSCPTDFGCGEDDCFNAVKDKLQELFGAAAAEFSWHPGLDHLGEPRSGFMSLRDATDASQSTITEWHFVLPVQLSDGTPGPGSFVGPEKTNEKCPVKIAFSVQPHERSPGEIDGCRIALAVDAGAGYANALARLALRALGAREDSAKIAHEHSDGNAGDCLQEAVTLCDGCVKHGRSLDPTSI